MHSINSHPEACHLPRSFHPPPVYARYLTSSSDPIPLHFICSCLPARRGPFSISVQSPLPDTAGLHKVRWALLSSGLNRVGCSNAPSELVIISILQDRLLSARPRHCTVAGQIRHVPDLHTRLSNTPTPTNLSGSPCGSERMGLARAPSSAIACKNLRHGSLQYHIAIQTWKVPSGKLQSKGLTKREVGIVNQP
jgi:hypothetical protein